MRKITNRTTWAGDIRRHGNKCWEGWKEMGTPVGGWRGCKLVHAPWKRAWFFLKCQVYTCYMSLHSATRYRTASNERVPLWQHAFVAFHCWDTGDFKYTDKSFVSYVTGKNFILASGWQFPLVDDIFISDLARHRVISGLATFLSAVTKYLTGSCIREEKLALALDLGKKHHGLEGVGGCGRLPAHILADKKVWMGGGLPTWCPPCSLLPTLYSIQGLSP